MPDTKLLLTGKIVIDKVNRSFKNASIHIYLEDVSFIDRDTNIIAQETIGFVSCQKGTKKQFTFSMYQNKIKINQKASYSISVHIDLKNNKSIDIGT